MVPAVAPELGRCFELDRPIDTASGLFLGCGASPHALPIEDAFEKPWNLRSYGHGGEALPRSSADIDLQGNIILLLGAGLGADFAIGPSSGDIAVRTS